MTHEKGIKYFSTFSGIGGFELGIERATAKLVESSTASQTRRNVKKPQGRRGVGKYAPGCVGYSEIDKYAVSTYQRHFPEHHNWGDITKINEAQLPDFDLLVGGFPCQAFSIAGKRGGFSDTRGTLFFDIARILKAKQPRLCLLENVKGLLSHDEGRTFLTIISTLDELGYDSQWQVLNSKDFGVPQNRERVFIVGHLRGTPRPDIFPLVCGDGTDSQEDVRQAPRVSGTLTNRLNRNNFDGSTTLVEEDRVKVFDDYNGNIRNDELAGTLTTNTGSEAPRNGQKILLPDLAIRRLTPTECERLQGFPDGWTEGVSDTQRYRQLGNAVTVNVIEAIISAMLE